MIRNYPVHPVVTITIAAAVTVRDLRGRAVVLVLPDPEAVPVPLVQWDLRAPRVNPDFKATRSHWRYRTRRSYRSYWRCRTFRSYRTYWPCRAYRTYWCCRACRTYWCHWCYRTCRYCSSGSGRSRCHRSDRYCNPV